METLQLLPHRKFEMKDRISSLPSNIIETILMCLPIKDAGRTSILSSRWRYEWSTIPHLIFDLDGIPSSLRRKLVEIVNQVLLLHNGPIHKFSYNDRYTYKGNSANIAQWLLILSRNGIKELKLQFLPNRVYKLPSTLFSCQTLVYLELHVIEIKLPHAYNGFGSLTTLYLENITITDDEFACLIFKCPHLRKLVFLHFYICNRLKVNAPNLHELVVMGPLEDLHLENAPVLAILSVGLEDDEEDSENENPDNFIRSLWRVLGIERLELGYNMIEFMAKGSTFGGFPTYSNLKKLHVCCFNFHDKKQIFILRCLLQSSLVLQELEIEADSVDSMVILPGSSFCQGKEWLDIRFDHLWKLEVVGIADVQPELEFIEFVLANAPVLEALNLGLNPEVAEDFKIYEQIMPFRRCSTQVKIN